MGDWGSGRLDLKSRVSSFDILLRNLRRMKKNLSKRLMLYLGVERRRDRVGVADFISCLIQDYYICGMPIVIIQIIIIKITYTIYSDSHNLSKYTYLI